MGEFAFFLCDKLKSISIPNGITRIEPDTFLGCDLLQHVDIPYTVVSIGKEAFMNCHSLKRLTIPNGVKEIGESAFEGCNKLEKVIIPESVKHIGQNAFNSTLAVGFITDSRYIVRISAFRNMLKGQLKGNYRYRVFGETDCQGLVFRLDNAEPYIMQTHQT